MPRLPQGALKAPSPGQLSASFEELQAAFAQECSRISGLLDGHARDLQDLCSSDAERPQTLPPLLARQDTESPTVRIIATEDTEIEVAPVVKQSLQQPMSPKQADVGQKVATPFVAWQFDDPTAHSQLRQGGACDADERGDDELPGRTCHANGGRGPPRLWRSSMETTSSTSTGHDSIKAGPPMRVMSSLSPTGRTAKMLGAPRGSQMTRNSKMLAPPTMSISRKRTSAFADPKALQECAEVIVWQGEYDVSVLYHDEGASQWLARHPSFICASMVVVFLNAVWIGVETDYNDKEVLYEADAGFILMENLFCIFFLWEWLVRLCAFRQKVQCIRDLWFVFDTVLLVTMVLETWILFIVSAVSDGGSGNLPTNLLRVVRLARLTRSIRIARFLRNIPELAVILRGIMVVMRTVFLILILLTSLLYVFGILFVQVARDTALDDNGGFRDVPTAMMTLLLGGLIPDMSPMTYALANENFLYAAMFMLFVFLGFITIMNMLIGVLVQVVSVVASIEAETNQLSEVKHVLMSNNLDLKEDDTISLHQINLLLSDEDVSAGLTGLSIDTEALMNHSHIVFMGREDITMYDFWQQAVQHQGGNVAKVRDLVNFRQFIYSELTDLGDEVKRLKEVSEQIAARSASDQEPLITEVFQGSRRAHLLAHQLSG